MRCLSIPACLFGLVATIVVWGPRPAHAEECVLDPNGTMGASSIAGSLATACGENARAGGSGSTVLGSSASAMDSHATAIGMGSMATRLDSETPIDLPDVSTTFAALAVGAQAAAAGFDSLAIGRGQ